MTATIIPTFIILLLGIVLGAVVGSLWGLGQHRHIYDWLSASLISRMQHFFYDFTHGNVLPIEFKTKE